MAEMLGYMALLLVLSILIQSHLVLNGGILYIEFREDGKLMKRIVYCVFCFCILSSFNCTVSRINQSYENILEKNLDMEVDSVFTTYVRCDSLYNRICPNADNPTVFEHLESLPQFPGGDKALMIFIRDNIQYPLECKEQAIQGTVLVKFIVDEFGKIICPYIRRTLHPALDKEALRVVKLMPDWKPASTNGVPCKMCYLLPIRFKL